MGSGDTLSLFFDKIWGNNEGFVYLPNRSPEKTWHKVFWAWPSEKEKVVKYVLWKTSEQHEVFFAPAIYRQPGAASNNNIVGSKVLWADFDGDGGTPAPANWADMSVGIVEPSIRVQTSQATNEHVYWLLDEFVTDLDFIEGKNRSIAYTLNSDPACWNANRLLRPPVSINFGYSKPERHGKQYNVTLKEYSDREYCEADFSHFKPIKVLIKENLAKATDLPSIEDIKMDCSWSDALKKMFRRSVEELIDENKDRSSVLVAMAMEAGELGWTDNQIYTLICDADDRWGKYRDRADRDFQRASIVDRVRRKIPYTSTEIGFSGLLGSPTEVSPQIVYKYGDFRALDLHVDWIIHGMLTSNGYGIIFGPSGVGKTQFGLQMARSIACQKDFLEWRNVSTRCRKVMFFSLEMGPADIKYFTDKMDKTIDPKDMEAVKENLLIVPLGEPMPLDKPEGKEFFEGLIKEYRPDVLFIDSLGTMTMGSLNEDGPARTMLEYVQQLRKTYGCAIYVIHHSNKGNEGPELTLQDFYGNTYLFTGTDFVIGLAFAVKDDSTTVRVSLCKMRLSGGRAGFDIFRDDNLSFNTFGEMDAVYGAQRTNGKPSTRTSVFGM